jgi:type I restriction enzyme, R subunit
LFQVITMPTSSHSNYLTTATPPSGLPSVIKENDIEYGFIGTLQDLKYDYRRDITDRASLEKNFREKFEALNRVTLTDSEFGRLLEEIVSPDVFTAAKTLREINTFTRDDGTPLNYSLVNLKDWCKNTFEVVNQLRSNTDNSHHRYDVLLLINGVPCVQIELKTLGISPRRAMEQIVDYKNDPGNGYTKTLLCFLQLFIVSNRDSTYYFANNNARHFAFDADERFLPVYEFADEGNKKISHLDDFAKSFLKKCDLGQTISRYMVLIQSEQKLMMMRPYQVYAVKALVDCIAQNCGNGYIWHTTGSGKTLTSFKASTLLKDNPDIAKCLFVVDRKDLDRQTREEFNRFQEGCVEENTNTASLVRRLLSEDYADKVIVTTIQKLGLALEENGKYSKPLEALKDKRIAFIFDECHRSQFGENHQAIKAFFPRAQLFGFTGTPIFDTNASLQQIEGDAASMRTTVDLFQNQLHAYTITHAIEDENVLRFHIDYFKPEGTNPPKPGEPIAKKAVVEAILSKHDAATAERRFNALLATASINDAIEYHGLFQTVQAERQAADPEFRPLNIACVFSPPAKLAESNEEKKDNEQIQEDLIQEKKDNEVEPEKKKAALGAIFADYNARYGTNHRVSEFDLYYQDVQKRIKDQQWPLADLKKAFPHVAHHKIDITIVVDMLLTGFDSKFLNTLYVDKNLKYHGLIQAFSRTNRVLNATKPYGNILDFRQQQDAVDAAIALFSGENTGGKEAREIWLVDKAPVVIEKLETAVQKLDYFMKSQGLATAPEAVPNLMGDAARAVFINHFKEIQRLKTQLDQYTDLTDDDKVAIEQVLPNEQHRGFKGAYLETAQNLKAKQGKSKGDKKPDNNAADQLDFELVLFASAVIDYDYIMGLIAKFSQQAPGKSKMSREQLIGLIGSDAKFMNERDDIADYINTLQAGEGLSETAIREGYTRFKTEKDTKELADLAERHGLAPAALQAFVNSIFERMIFDAEKLGDLFAPLDLGWKARKDAELALMADLHPLLTKRAGERNISGLSAYEQ